MSREELTVEGHDNRGSAGFGYVYFNDETRVGWTRDLDPEVWETNGPQWGPVTSEHIRLATEYLRQVGVLSSPDADAGETKRFSEDTARHDAGAAHRE